MGSQHHHRTTGKSLTTRARQLVHPVAERAADLLGNVFLKPLHDDHTIRLEAALLAGLYMTILMLGPARPSLYVSEHTGIGLFALFVLRAANLFPGGPRLYKRTGTESRRGIR